MKCSPTTEFRVCRAVVLWLLFAVAAPGRPAVWAQFESDIRFNFLAPGARSLAMGGAFLGLADDATAAYTNPAGLSNLTVGGPEVAVEFRRWSSSTLFLERGNLTREPTGIGIDTVAGSNVGRLKSDTEGLSFLSVGYVFPHRWTAALYRHELVNDRSRTLSQGYFLLPESRLAQVPRGGCNPGTVLNAPEGPVAIPLCRNFPVRSEGETRVVNYGGSVAYQLAGPLWDPLHDSLSVGVGLAWSQADILLVKEAYLFQPRTGNPEVDRRPGQLFGPADFTADRLAIRQERESQESDYTVTAGFLWKLGAEQRWNIGGAYRRGPTFELTDRRITGPALQSATMPTGSVTAFPSQDLRIPSSFGVGVAYTAAQGRTKVALDYDRVLYSQRLKESQLIRQKDADEYHLGFEQVFLTVGSLFVATGRAGVWYETAHDPEASPAVPLFLRQSLLQAEDHLHWSFGLGLVVKEDFQIDLGADLSDPIKTVSLSIVKFF
jgi:long-chain fatty acid transport protein